MRHLGSEIPSGAINAKLIENLINIENLKFSI